MFDKNLVLSIALHFGIIIVTTAISVPFGTKKPQFDEIIRVTMTHLPASSSEPEVVELPPEPVTPQALSAEVDDIPISDPESAPEEVIDDSEPEPEKKPEKQPYQPKAESGDNAQAGLDEGDADIESAAGSPFAGATVDNASFNYPFWFTQAFRKIQSSWRNPVASDYAIVCTISFQVLKSGRVLDARIQESSGVPLFDEGCLAAIERSAPFPPLPDQFRDEIIGITMPFKYQP